MVLGGESSLTKMSKAIVTTTGLQQQKIVVNEGQIADVKQAVAIDHISSLFSTTTSIPSLIFPYIWPNTIVGDVLSIPAVQTVLQTYNDTVATAFTSKAYEISTDSTLKSVHDQSYKLSTLFKNQPSTVPELAGYFPEGYTVVGMVDFKSEVNPEFNLQVYRNYNKDTLYGEREGVVLFTISTAVLGDVYAHYVNQTNWDAASESDKNSVIGQMLLKKGLELWSALETGEASVPSVQGLDLSDPLQQQQVKYMANACIYGAMVHLSGLAFSDSNPWQLTWNEIIDIFENGNMESAVPFVFFLNAVALVGTGMTGYIGQEANSLTDEANLAFLSKRTALNSEYLTFSYQYLDSDNNVIDITDNANDNTEVSSVNLVITNESNDIVIRTSLRSLGQYFRTGIPSAYSFLAEFITDRKFTIAQLKASRQISSSHTVSYDTFFDPATSHVLATNQLKRKFLEVMIAGEIPSYDSLLVSV